MTYFLGHPVQITIGLNRKRVACHSTVVPSLVAASEPLDSITEEEAGRYRISNSRCMYGF